MRRAALALLLVGCKSGELATPHIPYLARIETHVAEAHALSADGAHDEAARRYRTARGLAERAGPPPSPLAAKLRDAFTYDALRGEARAYSSSRRWRAAAAQWSALDLWERTGRHARAWNPSPEQRDADLAAHLVARVELGQIDVAASLARRRGPASVGDAELLERAARELDAAAGDPAHETAALNRWIARLPSAGLLGRRARVALLHGDAAAARADLDSALGRAPFATEYLRARGHACIALDDLTAAIRDFTHALGLDPADVEARYQRGRCLLLRGDFDAAAEDLEAVLARAPRDWPLRDNCVTLLLRTRSQR